VGQATLVRRLIHWLVLRRCLIGHLLLILLARLLAEETIRRS
jgi:hypothetical protein